jgi:hypothetical protein
MHFRAAHPRNRRRRRRRQWISEAYCCRVQKPEAVPPTPTTDFGIKCYSSHAGAGFCHRTNTYCDTERRTNGRLGETFSRSPRTHAFCGHSSRPYEFEDNILYRQYHRAEGSVSHLQIVIPTSLRQAFLEQLHCVGENVVTTHLGVRKTQAACTAASLLA